MSQNHYVTIMAGGIGSRFWPSSTAETPKQFLDILGVGKSLLRLTFERFLGIVPADRILVVTNERYKKQVSEHIPEIGVDQILSEPSKNNTAPSVAYTALRLRAMNPDAVFVTAPSDHVILNEKSFLSLVQQAFDFAENHGDIVTLGIEPTRADTGYGYIEIDDEIKVDGVPFVKRFREKPNLELAMEYVASGNYLWNAGIFIWKATDLIKAFEKLAPEIYSVLTEDISKYNTSEEQAYIDRVYPNTPSISVDYAILENATNVFTIPADIGWSDLGTWDSLHNYSETDEQDNLLLGNNIQAIDTTDCIIKAADGKIVVVKDLNDYIIIDEKDALLIYPKSKEQEIKSIVNGL